MKPSTVLLGLASVATHLTLGADGFVSPSNLASTAGGRAAVISGPASSRTHDVASISSSSISSRDTSSSSPTSRHLFPTAYHHTSRRNRRETSSSLIMMAGKKRRRRKPDSKGGAGPSSPAPVSEAKPSATAKGKGSSTSSSTSTSTVGAGQLGDVLEGDKGVEELFTDDWSDMPANTGMIKSNVALPDIADFKPTKRAEKTLEQREKNTAVGLVMGGGGGGDDAPVPASGLDGFESKLTPIVDRAEERRLKTAAERFEEGPVVRGLKTITWFSICTLVLWEIYINSPWFHAPESPPVL